MRQKCIECGKPFEPLGYESLWCLDCAQTVPKRKERFKKYCKEYYIRNRSRILTYQAQRRAQPELQEQKKLYMKAWRDKNREKMRAYFREYYRKRTGKV